MRKSLRTTPLTIEKFIEGAKAEIKEEVQKEDLHKYVRPTRWPLENRRPLPSLDKGRSDLKKTILIHLGEDVWNSLHRHTKALGVSKASWIRQAIMCLMEDEQLYFLSAKENDKS